MVVHQIPREAGTGADLVVPQEKAVGQALQVGLFFGSSNHPSNAALNIYHFTNSEVCNVFSTA